MDRSERQAQAARRLIAHLAEIMQAGVSVRLWTGEVLPLGPGARGDLIVAVASPGVLTRLLRRPRLSTVFELMASGAIELQGGTLLDFAARRGAAGGKQLWRRLDKWLLLRSLWPFLFGPAAAAADHGFAGAAPASDAAGRDNQALVQFHYDLSNDFYKLFLDPLMQYSCAYYPRWDATLEEAQHAKVDMICRKLRLRPGERFLDIGCGWGGLICHAARHYGVTAHGVTLSQAQFDYAQRQIAALGLGERVSVELIDYRRLTGVYDKIASIGMFEHVGLANHNAYFTKLRELLRAGGLLLNHAIARRAKKDARRFRVRRAEALAIARYIFPGGELDHIGLSLDNLERNGFEIHDVENWREHYARTCQLWCERLWARRAEAEAEVGAAKTRIWLLYLAGCSLAFARNRLLIYQTLASKRGQGPSGLPPTRADLYR
jgi:cyclopropane-fatty-acyl-phospholipid synthase